MIHRPIRNDVRYILGYHAQEFRHSAVLDKPIKANPEEAWLGVGYYFWLEEEFAHYWGQDKKKRTGAYDVYSAYINEDNILNASFNEKTYFTFRKIIEDAILRFNGKGKSITLKQVHRFLADDIWPKLGVKGIIFDDLPQNKETKERVYSYLQPFYYKKRIQLVAFDIQIIHKFAIYKEELC